MRYLALACDFDETLAADGRIDDATRDALERLLGSGRLAILVTGRELDDLLALLPKPEIFTRIVAENGAVLHDPATHATRLLAQPPPAAFVGALRARQMTPLSVGRVIVATRQPNDTAVLEVIRELGLELRVVFNRGAVMVLPTDVSKATGLAAALEELGMSAHNVVGIGDGENDHAFLKRCECAVAVANAVPMLQQQADYTTAGRAGEGVAELIDMLVRDDLQASPSAGHRRARGQAH